jgi:hypothetical protein
MLIPNPEYWKHKKSFLNLKFNRLAWSKNQTGFMMVK